MKKIIIITILVVASFIFPVSRTYAQSCGTKDDCQQLISQYEQKLSSIREQKNTLSSQINFMDTQIYLTGLKIQDTENNIKKTGEEIESLSGKIDNLNTSLDYLSRVFLKKVADGYKRREAPFVDIFLDSENASKLTNRLKYMQIAQDSDRKIAFKVEQAKANYEDQKKLREIKKIELGKLQDLLAEQEVSLNQQKVQKQKLLSDTQSDEATYQRLLSQAKAQLTSFRNFVQQSVGGNVIGANAFGSGSDGNYYSQRDARWASATIGYSPESVLDVGCLLTSISMVAKKLGQNVTPLDLARDTSRFWGNTAWMRLPWPGVAGKSYTSVSNVDQELANGNYVIAGVPVYNCAGGGNHFVVITRKEGNDYIMHDPIYGPDTRFRDHYSGFCTTATFK